MVRMIGAQVTAVRTALTEDEVRAVLATFRTEPCTEDDVRSTLELIFGVEWDE
jgi:hypothetical protein